MPLYRAASILLLALTTAQSRADDFLLGGIQINEADQTAWCSALVDAGFNTLQVTTYAVQGDWDSADLHADPVDEGTLKKIRAARAAGLSVVLILRLHTDHAHPRNRFLWHGLVRPKDDATLDAWFAKYTAYIVQWARAAEREGVTLLGIGSELNALAATVPLENLPNLETYYLDAEQQARAAADIAEASKRIPDELIRAPGDESPSENLHAFATLKASALARWAAAATFAAPHATEPERVEKINARRAANLAHWHRLIDRVRAVYRGPLTYAANFDNYADVAFWPRLDAMGINAYFPLRTPDAPADHATLKLGWESVWDEIAVKQADRGVPHMPVVFTELGYTRRENCTVAPWAWEGFDLIGDDQTLMVWETQPPDPMERVRAIQALHEVNQARGKPLAGLLYWKLTTVDDHHEREKFALKVRGRDAVDADPLQGALLRFLGGDE